MIPKPEDKPLLTIDETCALLGISRRQGYAGARRYLDTNGAEGIPVLEFGRRLMVPTAALRRLVGIDTDPTREAAPSATPGAATTRRNLSAVSQPANKQTWTG